jgi:hypothetical protein
MVVDSTAREEREELKRLLAAGAYRSSIDAILGSVGRALQKVMRRTEPPPAWVGALGIAAVISLIAYSISLATGGMSRRGYRTLALGGALIFLDLVLAKLTFAGTFSTLHDKLLDGLESGAGLAGLRDWMTMVRGLGRPVLIGLVIYAAYVVFLVPDPTGSPVVDIVIGGVMLLWTGFIVYYMYLYVVLALRLSRCHFRLHAEDPVSTEVLVDWSDMMKTAAYMFAIMLATGTLFTVSTETFTLRTLVFIVPRWLLLIALFLVNQMAISRVIARSKRRSLNEVEAQMANLRPGDNPPDHDSLETLLWLWDYRDRIKGTRNTALDFKGIADFFTTLLIPLVAFLVANQEAILDILGWIP